MSCPFTNMLLEVLPFVLMLTSLRHRRCRPDVFLGGRRWVVGAVGSGVCHLMDIFRRHPPRRSRSFLWGVSLSSPMRFSMPVAEH
eukprot:scaffold1590_cov239-Pinguiococcus_pyrenoidosus.AAC.19